MRTDRPVGRAGAVLLAVGMSVGMAVVLAACGGSDPVASTAATAAPSPTDAPLPPLPASAFPGVACDSLVGDAALGAILGDGAASVPPTIDEVALLQDGGLVCSWSAASSGASLSVRLVGDGVDHWATFNHWYEHTDWSDTVGEINGTQCSDDGCSVHALDGERFLEVEAASPTGLVGEDVEALARGILAAAPAPQPVSRSSEAAGSRSCTAALPEVTVLELLGSPATSASYVSTATPSYRLADDSFRRLGAVDCRLLSDDGRELVRFTILRGGAWVFRDDAPIGSPVATDDAAAARHGDDWLRVSAPDASGTVLQNLLTELASH